ncbi:catalase-related domain-containing protein [Cupriavidus plantarum]|uniref:catalase-related domain-containing protein n=1 Tax=Cupriavidus plantarum TaxID=942865 RepID=UPI00339D6CE5
MARARSRGQRFARLATTWRTAASPCCPDGTHSAVGHGSTTSRNGIGHDQEFADHFSQANLFWRSQSPVEQTQIVDAYTFELSKVSSPEIRQRVVGQLVHIAPELADQVAGKLGIDVVPVAPMCPSTTTASHRRHR